MGLFARLFGNAGIVDSDKLLDKYNELLTDEELIELGFKLGKETFVFTNKRVILAGKAAVTSSKSVFTSIGYRKISRFTVETAGTFELDATLKIWVTGEAEPAIVRDFDKSVNVYEVQKILTKYAF